MDYKTSGVGDEFFDDINIQMAIDSFEENGESGPHSTEGWFLSHLLNHCHKYNIPFTLVFFPEMGFYVKREAILTVIPEEMRKSFTG